jgi:hypothetical protein
MHRSGTSLVIRLLREMGLFIGRRLDSNDEPWFFTNLNDWLLRQACAKWDRPEGLDDLLSHDEGREAAADLLCYLLRSPRVLFFLGPVRYARFRSLFRLTFPWGWKDPRNTFTLPVWLDLFPGARVVHVLRHGLDVAASLRARAEMLLATSRRKLPQRGLLASVRRQPLPITDSFACLDQSFGFHLWERYVRRATEHVSRLGSRGLEVRYEELVGNPELQIHRLADFAGFQVAKETAERMAVGMHTNRRFAFASDPSQAALARCLHFRLAAYGYADFAPAREQSG